MDIHIDYQTRVNPLALERSQAAMIATQQVAQAPSEAEEKKYALDEELNDYKGPFKHNSEAAIAKYLTNMESNCQQSALSVNTAGGEAVYHSAGVFQAKGQPTTSDFLRERKETYQKIINLLPSQLPQIHFVMGNESADLDSVISSITYSYLLNQEHGSNQDSLYIPLLNIRKEELDFRKDIVYLLQLFNISPDDILFLDDNVPFNSLFDQDKLRINLVDHNLLRPSLEYLSDAVESIIDHHADENKSYPLLNNKEDKLIAVVGSATTLVAEKILANKQITLTPELATLLLGPVLIDTANLKSLEKTTERDRKVVESLLPIASAAMPSDYYERLMAAKSDVSNLTPEMLLSKDFKEYLDGTLLYGISSLPPSVYWSKQDEKILEPVLEKFAKDHGLAFLILLMNNPNPNEHNRKIIVYSPSEKLAQAFNLHVDSSPALNRRLIFNGMSSDKRINYYTTKDLLARKQLQPLFKFSETPELLSIWKKEMDKKRLD